MNDPCRDHDDVSRAYCERLLAEPHLELTGEIDHDLVDPVAVERDRVTATDAGGGPQPRAGPPVIRIRAVGERHELEVPVQAHPPDGRTPTLGLSTSGARSSASPPLRAKVFGGGRPARLMGP